MEDFASAAMMRLVRAGLKRQGLVLPAPVPASNGRVALGDKRAHIDALWQAHGPLAVARLGDAVMDIDDEPTLLALCMARDPTDLLARWQRLERFVHSRHRVVVTPAGRRCLTVQHVSLDTAAPPTAAEDLLVAGLLLALARRIGVQGLQARIAGRRGRVWFDGEWRLPDRPSALHTWAWTWQDTGPALPMPAHVDRCRALLQADPGRGWTLPALARLHGLSPRSLQRRLAAQGDSFSALLGEVRLNAAARWLTTSAMPIGEVGYVCGYADQPHFTREFRAHTAMTPAVYRAQFGVAIPGKKATVG